MKGLWIVKCSLWNVHLGESRDSEVIFHNMRQWILLFSTTKRYGSIRAGLPHLKDTQFRYILGLSNNWASPAYKRFQGAHINLHSLDGLCSHSLNKLPSSQPSEIQIKIWKFQFARRGWNLSRIDTVAGLRAATLLLGTSGTLCFLYAEDSSKTIFFFCMPA